MDYVRQKFPLLRLLVVTCSLALFASPQSGQPREVQAQINPVTIETPAPYDFTPVTENPVPVTHQSTITGEVFDDQGQPIAGARIKAANPDNPAETFETTTDSNGKYILAVKFTSYAWEALQKFNIDLFKPGHTAQQTIVETIADRTAGAGKKFLKKLDKVVTRITQAGGTHINEKGDVQIIVPPGALQRAADFRTTLYDHSQELPGPLPLTSQFTYAGDFDNEEAPLSEPATVKIANSLRFAPGLQIPIGYYNPETRQWDDSGNKATVDAAGEWLEYETDHFSWPDVNLPALPPPTAKAPTGSNNGPVENPTPEGTDRDKIACATRNNSQVDMQSGNLNEDFSLPGIRAMNQEDGLKFVYNSFTAKPSAVIKTVSDLDARYALQPKARSVKFEIEGIEASAFYQNSWGRNAERFLWDGTNGAGEIVSTGSYPYKVTLGNEYEGQYYTADTFGGAPIAPTGVTSRETVPKTTVIEGRVAINNQINSDFGAGWNLANLQRLHFDPEGSIVLVSGDGSEKYYARYNVREGRNAYWPFEDGTNPTKDIVGGHDGTLVGNVNFVPDTAPVPENLLALNLGGGPDYVETADANGLDFESDDPMTIAVWFKLTQLRDVYHILGKRDECSLVASNHRTNYQLARDWRLLQFSSAGGTVSSGVDAQLNSYTHMAVTYDGVNTLRIYIDGRETAVNTNYILGGVNNDPLKIAHSGSCPPYSTFPGIIDEVYIYGRALFKEEIMALVEDGPKADTIYVAPPGDYSRLIKNEDGTYQLIEKNQTIYKFNAEGLQTSEVDRNGNTIRYTYNADEQIETITYPGNVTYTFAYDPTSKKLQSVTDNAGRTTQFVVDANGDLVEIIKPDTTSRKFTYTPDHLMTTKTDENANTTDYVYDTHGRIKETITPEFDVWDGTQAVRERVSTLYLPSDTRGLINDFTGDIGTPQNPAPIIDPATLTDEISGPCGCSAVKGYTNKFGSWTQTEDQLGRITKYTRDADNNSTKIEYPNSRVTDMTYDGKGNLLTVKENYNSALTTFTYESVFNQVKTITDPLLNLTTFEYDVKGNLAQIKDDNNTVTEMAYLNNGLVESITQAKGIVGLENTSRFTYYAPTGNLWTTTDPLSHTTEMAYDPAGNLKTILDAEGKTTTYTSDLRNNNLTSVEDNLGNTTEYQYDNMGNLRYVTDAKDQATEFIYNELNLLSSIINPLTKTKQFTYNEDRLLGRILDAKGQQIKFEYDAAHQLTKKYLPEETLTYTYDTGGNLTSVKDIDSNISFTYDKLNLLTKAQTLTGGVQPVTTIDYIYDKNNNRDTLVDVNGKTFKYLYDNLNRLTDIPRAVHYDYDALSRRTQLTYPNSTSALYTYDLASQLTRLSNIKIDQIYFNDFETSAGSEWSSQSRDTTPRGGRKFLGQFGNDTVRFSLNNLPAHEQAVISFDLFVIQSWDGNYGAGPDIWDLTAPDAPNLLHTTFSNAGGLNQSYPDLYPGGNNPPRTGATESNTLGYSPWGDTVYPLSYTFPHTEAGLGLDFSAAGLQGLSDESWGLDNVSVGIITGEPSLISTFDYAYNDVGYRKSMTTSEGLHDYTYDDLYRLEGADHPDFADEAFTYDPVGNRKSLGRPPAWDYNAANQLLDDGTYTYEYDDNGNMVTKTDKISSRVIRYTYNSENQLIQISTPGAGTVKYAYDGLGRRIQKDVNGTKTKYVYDNEDIVAEYNTSNVLQATYLHGPGIDEPIRMTRGGQDYYYHADGLGSITELTNSTGTVVQTYKYDSFGNIVEQTPVLRSQTRKQFGEAGGDGITNPFTYTGREFDSESGLLYYRARYYDSRIGRFLQEDPVGGSPQNPQTLNRYPYVFNNPLNFLDPKGLQACNSDEECREVMPPVHVPGSEDLNKAAQKCFQDYLKSIINCWKPDIIDVVCEYFGIPNPSDQFCVVAAKAKLEECIWGLSQKQDD